MIDSDILAKLNNKRIGVLYGGLSSEREKYNYGVL